jgi:hypothetical protein
VQADLHCVCRKGRKEELVIVSIEVFAACLLLRRRRLLLLLLLLLMLMLMQLLPEIEGLC